MRCAHATAACVVACCVVVTFAGGSATASNGTAVPLEPPPPTAASVAPVATRTRTISRTPYVTPVVPPALPRTLAAALAGQVDPAAADGLVSVATFVSAAGGLAYPALGSKALSVGRVFSSMNCAFDPATSPAVVGPPALHFILPLSVGYDNAEAMGAASSTAFILFTVVVVGTLVPPPPESPHRVGSGRVLRQLSVPRRACSTASSWAVAYFGPNVASLAATLASHGASAAVRGGGVISLLAVGIVFTWGSVSLGGAVRPKGRRKVSSPPTRWATACACLFGSATLGVDDIRSAPKRVHVFVDLGVDLLVAVAAGIRPGDPVCAAVGLFQGCVVFGHLIFIVVVQPTASDELNFFIGWVRASQTALCVLLSVLAIRGPSAEYETAGIAAGWVAVVTLMTITVTAGFLVYRGLHVLVADGIRVVSKRKAAKASGETSDVSASSEETDDDAGRESPSGPPPTEKIVAEMEERASPERPSIPRYVPPPVPLLAAIPSMVEQRRNPLAESESAGFESAEAVESDPAGSDSEAATHRGRRWPVSPTAARRPVSSLPASRSASQSADHAAMRRRALVDNASEAAVVRHQALRESRPQYSGTPPPPDEEPLVFPSAWGVDL